MITYVVCVCYLCCMFYRCVIMDLESVNKHLLIVILELNSEHTV